MSTETVPTKGAGTYFSRLKEGSDIGSISDFKEDTEWLTIGKVKDFQPGELTIEDDEDDYLDSPTADWSETSPGQKSGGETQITIAWMPGDDTQKQLFRDVEAGTKTWYRAKYPNGGVDVWYGYINSLGKTIAIKEKMQRTIKIKNCAMPKYAETLIG
ncbi:phage tail tube protein [Shewanella surugensis]|uniref:Lambda phage tail tube protein N-terminal domain-containing protein n=1 Tax=Shewanella surugensis TaxID=212020 RepID=A0ABT0L955_9GAMM|nr:phage tail tube protein [Shewanella surugensis]MCL1124237.1 hypothetical protein [Shewanella surugensis]